MEDLQHAAEQIASLMKSLTAEGRFRLKFRITAGAGAADPSGFERRDLYVECKGADAGLLVEHDGELLRALEHIAAKILRLEPEEHDRISFDANGFKAERAESVEDLAEDAIEQVEETGEPFRFAPMNSRERRMLHMYLKDSGLQTSSTGEGAARSVVLYPAGYEIPPEQPRSGYGDRRGGSGGYGNRGRGAFGQSRPSGSGGRGGDRRGGGGGRPRGPY